MLVKGKTDREDGILSFHLSLIYDSARCCLSLLKNSGIILLFPLSSSPGRKVSKFYTFLVLLRLAIKLKASFLVFFSRHSKQSMSPFLILKKEVVLSCRWIPQTNLPCLPVSPIEVSRQSSAMEGNSTSDVLSVIMFLYLTF